MRRSIQMMTHTSIILAGGLKRQPPSEGGLEDGVIEEENNDTNNNNNTTSPPEQRNLLNHHHSNHQNSNNNSSKKQKGFKERIQNKLAFTFHPSHPCSEAAATTERDNHFSANSSMMTTPEHGLGVSSDADIMNAHIMDELARHNGNTSMGRALPEINIDSPPPSSKGGTFESRPTSVIGLFENPPPYNASSSSGVTVGVGGGNKIMKANKGEAVWFIENHEQQSKESSI